jgi:hypothetical protein
MLSIRMGLRPAIVKATLAITREWICGMLFGKQYKGKQSWSRS